MKQGPKARSSKQKARIKRIEKMPKSERMEIEQFAHRLVQKLLHEPSRNLRQMAQEEDSHIHIESIAKLFDLSTAP